MKIFFTPQGLIGREAELKQVCQLLQEDRDCAVTGIPGIGRRRLLRTAAKQVGSRSLEIDCLRCHSARQFLRLLADSLIDVFSDPAELAKIQQWSQGQPLTLDRIQSPKVRLIWPTLAGKEWALFQGLLALPQQMAEWLGCRVVVMFYNFPHIRSWDRQGKWETYLRQEIQLQSRVSYALISTVAEPWVYASQLPVIHLAPLTDAELQPWLMNSFARAGLKFDSESQAVKLFLSYVQGHIKDAITLAQRLWLNHQATEKSTSGILYADQVHSSMLSLVQDIGVTFEALLLLLPLTQARLLESLALDPTHSPQSTAYIKKHQLSRGGGLQGALNSLEQKGLIYGPRFGYRIALPLLDFWLKQRL
ncbi:AAA family ATPase [Vasconcelosia minhoensis]|nr:ATP-binding protein [Romeria gracilis]